MTKQACIINKFLEKFIKGLAKFKWDDKKGHLVQKVIIRKRQISAKMASMPKFIKGLAKYSNEMTKSGMLTVGDFYKNDKFGENSDFGRK